MPGCFVLLNCKENQEKDVISQIRKIPEVKEMQCVSGPYDILVKVQAPTIDEMHDAVTWKIRKLKNVRSTYSLKINEEATDCQDDN